jgi:hypothetical protein
VIAETIPGAYDAEGRKISASVFQRKVPSAGMPIGRYVSQPLTVKCASIDEVRRFLARCGSGHPVDLFGKYCWQPPEDFERLRKGACADFALWTWRQMLALGYDARFVSGKHGRYGEGHAWVEYFEDGKCFLVEPQFGFLAPEMPRLMTLEYEPQLSVGFEDGALKFYEHKHGRSSPPLKLALSLLPAWLVFWARTWGTVVVRLPRLVSKLLGRKKRSVASG